MDRERKRSLWNNPEWRAIEQTCDTRRRRQRTNPGYRKVEQAD